jgi:hypothetical protein
MAVLFAPLVLLSAALISMGKRRNKSWNRAIPVDENPTVEHIPLCSVCRWNSKTFCTKHYNAFPKALSCKGFGKIEGTKLKLVTSEAHPPLLQGPPSAAGSETSDAEKETSAKEAWNKDLKRLVQSYFED